MQYSVVSIASLLTSRKDSLLTSVATYAGKEEVLKPAEE